MHFFFFKFQTSFETGFRIYCTCGFPFIEFLCRCIKFSIVFDSVLSIPLNLKKKSIILTKFVSFQKHKFYRIYKCLFWIEVFAEYAKNRYYKIKVTQRKVIYCLQIMINDFINSPNCGLF